MQIIAYDHPQFYQTMLSTETHGRICGKVKLVCGCKMPEIAGHKLENCRIQTPCCVSKASGIEVLALGLH